MTHQVLCVMKQRAIDSIGVREDDAAVVVEVEEARSEGEASEVDPQGILGEGIGRAQARRDPPALEQERTGLGRGALRVEQQRTVKQQPPHRARV